MTTPSTSSVPPGPASGVPVETSTADAGTQVGRGGGSALALALPLAFVSGAAALVYEVAWTRRALLVVGSTSAASAVVLAAFLGGLGVGGLVGGPIADRSRRPLALYGALECAAAVWAAAFPWVVAALETAYVAVAAPAGPPLRLALRLLVAAVAVAPGALALGATYPALLAAVARRGARPGPAAAWIYGVNTAGAVVGSLWCGFTGIFALGVAGAMRAAAGAAGAAGFVAVVAARRTPAGEPLPVVAAPDSREARAFPRGALASALVGGFVGLGIEASGSRALVFFVEGFTASFAAMLAVFLAGLAAGSLLVGPWFARLARPSAALGVLFLLAGLAVLVEAASIGSLDGLMRDAFRHAYGGQDPDPRAGQRWMALAGATAAFALPALLLGATYPLAVAWASQGDRSRAGAAAGRVAAWNTVGAVAGPLAVLALGRIGASGGSPGGPLLAWTLLGVLAAGAGAWFLLAGVRSRAAALAAGVVALAAGGVVVPGLVARASPESLVRASHVLRASRPEGPYRLLAVRSDDVTTASVVATGSGERVLYTDDFAAAATGRDYPYMRFLGHLPVLGAASPRRALVIAFGTGTTAGAVARHPGLERIEVVDTSRAVLGLESWFRAANQDVTSDRRVVVRADDGRHALLVHPRDLDVVTLEPLLPTTPAALPFYTREFYELARSRVVDGGVVCQWVPVHAMPLDLYASCLRTFFETFPDGSLWFFEQSTVLLGHVGRARPTPEEVRARGDEVEASLRVAGLSEPSQVALGWVATGKRVLAALDASPPGPLSRTVVTDDRPTPEAYPAPRGVPYAVHPTLSWLASLVAGDDDADSVPEASILPRARRSRMRVATKEALLGRTDEAVAGVLRSQGLVGPAVERLEGAARHFEEARRSLDADERSLARHAARVERLRLALLASASLARSDALRAAGRPSEAAGAADDALALAQRAWAVESSDPLGTEKPFAATALANALLRRGRCAAALDVLAAASSAWPWDRACGDLLLALDARARGAPAGTSVSEGARRALEASPPCSDGDVASVRGEVDLLRGAVAAGRVDVDAALSALVSRANAAGVARLEIAGEVRGPRGGGDAPASAGREVDADVERDALLRLLDPGDPALRDDLASDDDARRRAALRVAGRVGFERLAARAEAADLARSSGDEGRRLAFLDAALADGSAWALDRAVDLLLDPGERVRAAAWSGLVARAPADRLSSAGYDPRADAASRRAAVDRVRALVAPR